MSMRTTKRMSGRVWSGMVLAIGAAAFVALLGGPLAGAAHAAGDTSMAHIDGYISISPDGRCVVLRQHDGSTYSVIGRWQGLLSKDHVRLEGHIGEGGHCGAQSSFELAEVQTVWGDDNHKTTFYDHLKDGRFRQWAERTRPQTVGGYGHH